MFQLLGVWFSSFFFLWAFSKGDFVKKKKWKNEPFVESSWAAACLGWNQTEEIASTSEGSREAVRHALWVSVLRCHVISLAFLFLFQLVLVSSFWRRTILTETIHQRVVQKWAAAVCTDYSLHLYYSWPYFRLLSDLSLCLDAPAVDFFFFLAVMKKMSSLFEWWAFLGKKKIAELSDRLLSSAKVTRWCPALMIFFLLPCFFVHEKEVIYSRWLSISRGWRYRPARCWSFLNDTGPCRLRSWAAVG